MKYVKRELEAVLLKVVQQSPAIVVTGPRQAGKSTLLKTLFPDYTYITLDDPFIRQQAIDDPELLLQSRRELIIDEIQYAPELLSYLKIMIDEKREQKGQFILTGSQQFSLMKGVSESLAGRAAIFHLAPFSHSEIYKVKDFASTQEGFLHACVRGMYPEVALQNEVEKQIWYGSYVQTYLERDIKNIYGIGNLRDFQNCLKLLAAQCSQSLNMSTLSKEIGVSVNTVKSWVSILEASGIIYLLKPYYNNLGKRITKAPKVYFMDVGLVCYLTGIRTEEHVLQGPLTGALFENFCVQELVKSFYGKGEEVSLYYYQVNRGIEVDILIQREMMKLQPVEVKVSKTPKVSMASNLEKFVELFGSEKIIEPTLLSLSEKSIALTRSVDMLPLKEFVSNLK